MFSNRSEFCTLYECIEKQQEDIPHYYQSLYYNVSDGEKLINIKLKKCIGLENKTLNINHKSLIIIINNLYDIYNLFLMLLRLKSILSITQATLQKGI